MSDPIVRVIIPFRDRGIDPRRQANLDVVQAWWYVHGIEANIVDDGLTALHKSDCAMHNAPALPVGPCDCGAQEPQFNRHRAYNRAVERFPETSVFVFSEADMLIPPVQILTAIQMAADQVGLVVPFTQYRYLSDSTTEVIREVYEERGVDQIAKWWAKPVDDPQSVFGLKPESVRNNGKSIGAINVMSRESIEMVGGFTELTSGNWFDDRIVEEAFRFLTGQPTRWVKGPAVHLYHLPGWEGDHLTEADRAATRFNKEILIRLRQRIRVRQHEAVRDIMQFRRK